MAGKGKKLRHRMPKVTMALFAAAAVLLLASTVGGAQAALSYASETYNSRVQMSRMGVALLENDKQLSGENGALLGELLKQGEAFLPGKVYDEKLTVSNTGEIAQYVRVTLYKYWTDKNGEKLPSLSPELIQVNTGDPGKWLLDQEASTGERMILYYKEPLEPGNTTTEAVMKSFQVDARLANRVSQEEKDGVITTTYEYDGVQLWLAAEVDAVQTHSASQAILSAWGRKVTFDEKGFITGLAADKSSVNK